ncbi:MAG TPA: sigma-70 family RNA polymerase sigma factor [Terriglobales bacterium]|nr:sigma-70 family RNA polymerase sigma factor [Terriglobales bacterium]
MNGLEKALEELTPAGRAALVTFARHWLNQADAEDVVQTTLLKAWRVRDEFRGDTAPMGYLRHAVRNQVFELFRRTRIRREQSLETMTLVDNRNHAIGLDGLKRFGVEDRLDERLDAKARLVVISRQGRQAHIPDITRVGVLLSEGQTYEQIARSLHLNANSLKTNIFRLRLRLAKAA